MGPREFSNFEAEHTPPHKKVTGARHPHQRAARLGRSRGERVSPRKARGRDEAPPASGPSRTSLGSDTRLRGRRRCRQPRKNTIGDSAAVRGGPRARCEKENRILAARACCNREWLSRFAGADSSSGSVGRAQTSSTLNRARPTAQKRRNRRGGGGGEGSVKGLM